MQFQASINELVIVPESLDEFNQLCKFKELISSQNCHIDSVQRCLVIQIPDEAEIESRVAEETEFSVRADFKDDLRKDLNACDRVCEDLRSEVEQKVDEIKKILARQR